jgi:DNA-binding SARP family transcriptional activator/tetratricopeptide (TPR) repeat protein
VLAVGVLGPLEVTIDGRPVELTSGRLRTLLVVLAMAGGSPLPVDRLATALWEDDLPAHVRRVVQTYLARLRGALGGGLITTEPAGYRLRVEPEQVDALRFARLLDAAARAADPASERAGLAAALALWRGTPFDGLRSGWLARAEAPRLVERYLAALERRIDLDLADGRHGELVAQLHELTALHPLRESLWVRLLVTLDRCGRQAEALTRYETVRVRLADELGVNPGPELQQVHADLLTAKPVQRLHSAPAREDRPVVPRQLPAAADGFTGRTAALAALDALLGNRDAPTAVVISAIAGTAGIGKTTLAVHWAHQVVDRFPDGQLYVNLRGFHPAGHAMAPADAVRGFLGTIGVAASQLPSDPDAQIGLYRSLLAGKRMLVVLDNARDPDQVRPLLPGSGTCLVLVTSRNQLTGLVAAESARPLVLDLLTGSEARELLARRLGRDRVSAEPAAVDTIVARCAGLPLALAIAAARAATHPALPLAAVAHQLDDAPSILDTLDTGDPAADARTVFSWSYHALGEGAARLFRLLALHPGPDISAVAAASLAGIPLGQVRRQLAELAQAHLILEQAPGRFSLHDLLRAYASELAGTHDTAADRHAATQRVLDHYLHSAYAAAGQLNPHRDTPTLTPPAAGATPEPLATYDQGMHWFTAERAVLLAVVDHAAAGGWDTHTWQLAWTLTDFLDRRVDWQDMVAVGKAAVAAASRLAEAAIQVRAHRDLADVYLRLGRYGDAQTHLKRALDLDTGPDCHASRARTHYSLADLSERQDRYADAFGYAQQALALFQAAGHPVGQAHALNAVGWYNAKLGDYGEAIVHCRQALTLLQEHGDREGQAHTLDSLGYAYHRRGRLEQAVTCYQQAVDLLRELGSRYREATTLVRLGDTHDAAGDRDAARAAWQRALVILDELGHSDVDHVRTKLRTRGGVS